MEKVEVEVLGISYGTSQNTSYQLMLYNEDSGLTMSIVIGSFEAQSIAIQLEKIVPPRPLTHDLILSILDRVTTERIEHVDIYKLEEGIFFSKLVLTSGIEIDCRTSDAISVALRSECPVYVKTDILQKVGIKDNQIKNLDNEQPVNDVETLEKKLADAIANENYELASKLKQEIEKLKE
jgi:uncharacterized protein